MIENTSLQLECCRLIQIKIGEECSIKYSAWLGLKLMPNHAPLTAISCHRHVIIAPDKIVTYFYTKQLLWVLIGSTSVGCFHKQHNKWRNMKDVVHLSVLVVKSLQMCQQKINSFFQKSSIQVFQGNLYFVNYFNSKAQWVGLFFLNTDRPDWQAIVSLQFYHRI